MVYRHFLHAFLKCIQNSLEYLIQNTIHQAIQINNFHVGADILNLLLYEHFVFPRAINAKI